MVSIFPGALPLAVTKPHFGRYGEATAAMAYRNESWRGATEGSFRSYILYKPNVLA